MSSADPGSAEAAAEALVHAVVWGEHTVVWELLSSTGRNTALTVAQHNGMDRVAAGRIRDGLADPVELDDFLRQLLGGIRRDLRSIELGELQVDHVELSSSGDEATGHLVVPSTIPGVENWSAGTLRLSHGDDGRWLIDHLEPRIAGP